MIYRILLSGAVLLLLWAATAAAAEAFLVEDDLIVDEDMVVHELVVTSGSTLDVQGATLHLSGRLFVDEGATLRLGPRDGLPTRLLAGDEDGFWLEVHGHVVSSGTPRTVVDGLSGQGLDSVMLLPGGFQINGTGDLQDIIVRNGTAGLIVGPDGDLHLRDAEVKDLFLMGLATRGRTVVERTDFLDNIISLTGKGSCSVEVRDSTFYSMAAHFQMNSCDLRGQGLELEGGSVAIVTNGPMELELQDVLMTGYGATGLRGDGGSSITLRNMTLLGAPGASEGIRLKPGNALVLEQVVVRGHTKYGLDMQSSSLQVDGSAFLDNGEYGLRMVKVDVDGLFDALAAQDFGKGTSEANGEGAIDVRHVVQAAVLEDGQTRSGLELEVVDEATGEVVYSLSGPSPLGAIQVHFPALREVDDRFELAGPFRYEAKHPLWDEPQEGPIDPAEEALVFEVATQDPADPERPVPRTMVVLLVLAATIVGYALLERPLRRAGARLLRRRQEREP